MSANFSIRQVEDIVVIDARGRITMEGGTGLLGERIRGELRGGRKRIVLNFADVTYVDSSGIGEMYSAFAAVASQDGQLKLLNPTKRIRELLRVTGLYKIFEIFDDETSAVSSFASPVFTGPYFRRGGLSEGRLNE